MGHVSLVRNFRPSVKEGLKKIASGSVESRIARLLSRYRVTCQSTTGRSPAELMFGRKLRNRLTLVKNHDTCSKQRDIN